MKRLTVRQTLVSRVEDVLTPYLAKQDADRLRELALQYALSLARERPIMTVRAWLLRMELLNDEAQR